MAPDLFFEIGKSYPTSITELRIILKGETLSDEIER
jgi:hypothetical protein